MPDLSSIPPSRLSMAIEDIWRVGCPFCGARAGHCCTAGPFREAYEAKPYGRAGPHFNRCHVGRIRKAAAKFPDKIIYSEASDD